MKKFYAICIGRTGARSRVNGRTFKELKSKVKGKTNLSNVSFFKYRPTAMIDEPDQLLMTSKGYRQYQWTDKVEY